MMNDIELEFAFITRASHEHASQLLLAEEAALRAELETATLNVGRSTRHEYTGGMELEALSLFLLATGSGIAGGVLKAIGQDLWNALKHITARLVAKRITEERSFPVDPTSPLPNDPEAALLFHWCKIRLMIEATTVEITLRPSPDELAVDDGNPFDAIGASTPALPEAIRVLVDESGRAE